MPHRGHTTASWTAAFALIALTACSPSDTRAPLPEPDPDLSRALSVRDPAPGCEAIEARHGAAGFSQALLVIAEQVTEPAWVPLRVAGCLVQLRAEDAQPAMELWVSDEMYAGLGRLVIRKLDELPEQVAVPVARKALSGQLAILARDQIAASPRSAVRAVLTEEN
jgi:hypothetical protein